MLTLALYSNKGGVGKTAAAVNLSYMSVRAGAKTLICDLDPQSSATYYFRVKPKLKSGKKGFLKGGKQIYKSIKGTDYENLDLLPAEFSLRHLDATFAKLKRSKQQLKTILKSFNNQYDLVVLDCPVTITLLAENIFNAADFILVPMIPTTLSLRTYRQLLTFSKKNNYNTGNIYTFFSMVDRHKKMHHDLMATVSKEFEGVLPGSIPYLAQIEKMGIYREPVSAFAPLSPAAKSYQKLWDEVQETILTPKK